ncbi:MAG: tRNA pseudouridine(38-40) synthase TruA [Anaerolineae bacterium]|nr:MAG: tRNA pseudouridine(38-40) synthase TruA [Anaerolineae bacterium]
MARYQIILAYDGSNLWGSQRQANRRTAQGELETALRQLGWQGRSVLMAGRTDTGVHATGQVAAFDLEWSHRPEELVKALNSHLPADLAVRGVKRTREDFHPRFDARSRRYRYRLYCQEVRDPLRERYAWRLWPPLHAEGLYAVAQLLHGTHDFAAFGTPPRPESSTIRTVMQAVWRQQDDEWTFEVEADAFLYRMVRRMVYLQVAVGQGKLAAQAIADVLASKPGIVLPAGLAPAHGLTLLEVTYPE